MGFSLIFFLIQRNQQRDTGKSQIWIRRFIILMKQPQPPPRIRKSLAALAGTDERKGYFYCLKMLGILPPPPGSGFEEWTSITPVTQPLTNVKTPSEYYVPKCLHDVLINSHATSCEHRNFYFSFYHRHLMILTQIFLNFAHQVLRGGIKKLQAIYPPHDFAHLYGNEKQIIWESVFSTYQSLEGIPDEIANHYWNPTNYLSESDLKIPDQLAFKPILVEPIDKLFHSINKSAPWEVHVPRRWYNKEISYKRYDLEDRGILSTKQSTYTENQLKFIAGKLDPRTNPAAYQQEKDGFINKFAQNNDTITHYRNTIDFDNGNKRNYRLNGITADESLAVYGAKVKNTQYITLQEEGIYQLQRNFVQSYNQKLPHYQYAYSLFANKMSEFLEGSKGIEVSHNTIHNNFGYILNDASFSVNSLVFYPYHSAIDAMIELKLRRGNAEDDNSQSYDYFKTTLNDKYSNMPTSIKAKLYEVFNIISQQMAPMSEWFLSGEGVIGKQTGGIYPILQWISPQITQKNLKIPFSPAFCSRDFVLTRNNIRSSLQFTDIYQKYYAKTYLNRYAFFDGITTFNYNYNYQLSSDPNDLMDEFGSNLPKYLLDMSSDIMKIREPVKVALQKAVTLKIEGLQKLKKSAPRQLQAERLKVRKLFDHGSIQLFVSYPPNITNRNYSVSLQLHNVIEDLYDKLPKRELEEYLRHGFEATNILIFGKENSSSVCYKCIENKVLFLNLDDDIRRRELVLWRYLHFSALNEVYYDSSHPNNKLKCICDKLILVPNPSFADYRLVTGAEEILIDVESEISSEDDVFLRIDAESHSIRKNSRKTVLSKKELDLDANFDFYKIFDVEDKSLFFDHFVYKKLKVWASVGAQRLEFSVSIPSYQRLLRLTLIVSLKEGKLHAQLVDSDYQAKKAYYQAI